MHPWQHHPRQREESCSACDAVRGVGVGKGEPIALTQAPVTVLYGGLLSTGRDKDMGGARDTGSCGEQVLWAKSLR